MDLRSDMHQNQRFRRGVGGRGLATSSAQNTGKMTHRIVSSYFTRRHRKKRGLNFGCGRDFLALPLSANPFSKLLTKFKRANILRVTLAPSCNQQNALSIAGNSTTSSERPSPEPLLKKEVSPAVLRRREVWKCSGSLNRLE